MAETRLSERQDSGVTGKGNAEMIAIRRLVTILTATLLFAAPSLAHAETVRIGLPTKTYWPTTVAEAAVHQKLFEKEGITAELTIYRGGAECFEALAAGGAGGLLRAA